MSIWNSFENLKKTNWDEIPNEDKDELIKSQSRELWNYYAKFTDYICNVKIYQKDIAVIKEYLKPLKWDKIITYKTKLGNSAKFLTECFESDYFWLGLK